MGLGERWCIGSEKPIMYWLIGTNISQHSIEK
ncbi:MAG: hypothetical protein FD129_372, partial [bacterium]